MKLEKIRTVTDKLHEIATENEVTIFSGNKNTLDEITKDFDGMNVFITDGTPSQEKVIRESGESVKYEATTTIHLSKKPKKETLNDIVSLAVEKFPELRFHQILHGLDIIIVDLNSDFIDDFYTKDEQILKRVKETDLYKKLKD